MGDLLLELMQESLHALELLLEFVTLFVFAGLGSDVGFLVQREPLLAFVSSRASGFAVPLRLSLRPCHASYDVLHTGTFGLEVFAHRPLDVCARRQILAAALVLLSEIICRVGLGGQVQEVAVEGGQFVVNGFTQEVRYNGAVVVGSERLVVRASAKAREQVLGFVAVTRLVHALFRWTQIHVFLQDFPCEP